MANKMLIDATHPEETRVVVLRGNRVEEFDFESASRRQLRGNIYLAKVTRVEPSLQAAFVDYGGNRHGFLAFSEIHPDYYQIPVADRQALIAEEERAQRAAEAEAPEEPVPDAGSEGAAAEPIASAPHAEDAPPTATEAPIELAELESTSAAEPMPGSGEEPRALESHSDESGAELVVPVEGGDADADNNITEVNGHGSEGEEEAVESVGGADAMEEVPERMPRLRRQYKIQEVIKRRQVMLVQVVKEERGTKGA